jgi:cystathionine beta-synthase
VDDGRLLGMVTEVELLDHMLMGGHTHDPAESIKPLVRREVATVAPDTSLETLMSIFATRRAVLVMEGDQLVGIIAKIDLLDFLARQAT